MRAGGREPRDEVMGEGTDGCRFGGRGRAAAGSRPQPRAPSSQLPTLSTSASSSLLQPRLLILSAPNPGPGVNWLQLH